MRLMTRTLCIGALAAAGFAGASAQAADTPWYFGLTAGQADYDISGDDADAVVLDAFVTNGFTVLSGNSSLDTKDSAFGALAGLRLLPYLAVEAAYVDLGEAKYAAAGLVTDGVSVVPASIALDAQSKGPTVSALGILPLTDQWELFARGGVFFAKTEQNANVLIGGFPGSDRVSDNSVEGLAGIGGALNLGEHFTIRAEFARYFDVGDDDTGEIDIDVLSAGFIYRL